MRLEDIQEFTRVKIKTDDRVLRGTVRVVTHDGLVAVFLDQDLKPPQSYIVCRPEDLEELPPDEDPVLMDDEARLQEEMMMLMAEAQAEPPPPDPPEDPWWQYYCPNDGEW